MKKKNDVISITPEGEVGLRLVDVVKVEKVLLETVIQGRLIKKFREAGFIVVRNRATDVPGWPDLTLYYNGVATFIEVKRTPKHKLSKEQIQVHTMLKAAGFNVYTLDNRHVKKTINLFIKSIQK